MGLPAGKAEIVVALDVSERSRAIELVDALAAPQASARFFKVGPRLFLARGCGRDLVEDLVARGLSVFLDLKFFDIPNTVNAAASEARSMGAWCFTVHALGGDAVLSAAVAGARGLGLAGSRSGYAVRDLPPEEAGARPLVFAVTTLTSEARQSPTAHLTEISARCGVDGVVMPGTEVPRYKPRFPGLLFVVPGVRPVRDGQPEAKVEVRADDQVRTVAPGEAYRLGADYLVVGRPVIESRHPVEAYLSIKGELEAAGREGS